MNKTPEAKLASNRRWRARNRAYLREYDRRYRANNPERKAGHNAVYRATHKSGTMARPDLCEGCGAPPEPGVPLQGHHDDYSDRLAVRFLCPACHADQHPDRH